MVKLYCVYGCPKDAVSDKRRWPIFQNDKPAVDSLINYEKTTTYITSMVNADTFKVRIRHTESTNREIYTNVCAVFTFYVY